MSRRYAPGVMQNSALGHLGRRILGWVVIAVVAILAIKLIVGAVFGLVTMLFTLALVAAAVVAVLWALRQL